MVEIMACERGMFCLETQFTLDAIEIIVEDLLDKVSSTVCIWDVLFWNLV